MDAYETAHDAYMAGYKRGRNAMLDDFTGGLVLLEAARKAGFPHLDGICVRYDAATKEVVVWDLTGRELRL